MAQAFRTQNLRLLASILDANDNELIKSPSPVASAVNELTITNAATSASPSISATGDDTNIGLNLISKGTGLIQINGKAISLANSFTTIGNFSLAFTTTGNTSLTLPTSGTLATTSQIPTVYDNTLTLAGSGGVSVSATPTFTANASADKTITITIADAALTLAKLANIGGSTILGNSAPSSAGAPAALSVATVASMLSNQTMNIVGTATSVTDIVLVAKGGTGVATSNANTIFVGPSTGAAAGPSFRAMVTADIPTGIVTYAKIQYVANTARVLGRISSLSGEIEELTGANIVTIIDTNAVSRATNLAGGIAGQIPYQSGANTTAFSAAGTASQVLLSGAAGAPTWASQSTLSVGSATTAGSVINALTISSPLTGTSYNGSTAISIGLQNASDTLAGGVSTGAQTFAGNKTFKDAVIISGDLTVNGTTITINSSTLSVDDKNIELGAVIAIASLSSTSNITATSNIVDVTSTSGLIVGQALTKISGTGAFGTNPIIDSIVSATQFTVIPVHATTGNIVFSVSGATDITADTGGITLKGATNKTFNWLNTTSSWTSSENLDIVTGKTYKINNVAVLSATTLGSSVVNSSLTSVGTLTNLTVTNTITGSVSGSAGSLSGTYTFWGQSFNGTQNVSGSLTSVGNITGSSAITITAGGSNQNVVLTPTGTGYTLLNGNVGIGLTAPDLRLHIEAANAYPATTGTAANGFLILRAKTAGGTHGMYLGVANASPFGSWIQCSDSANLATNYPLLLNPNGGNVGIGINSPSGVLDIQSSNAGDQLVRTWNTNTAGTGKAILRVANNGNNAQGTQLQFSDLNYYVGTIASDRTNGMAFYVGQQATPLVSERMRIDISGNIGIGTIAPVAKLHINSTTSGAILLRTDGTNGTLFSVVDDLSDSLMSVNNSAGLPVLEVFADDRIVAGQYGQNDLVLVNNKIGIGTASPINKLSVIGSASIGDSTYNVSAPTNGLIIQGDVGIGTATPTAQTNYRFLQVNGSVSAIIETTVAGVRIGGFDSTSNALFVGTIGAFPIVFRTGVNEKWRITNAGVLQSSTAQTIQTATGILTLATLAGDGNIILSPHGNGNVGIGDTTTTAKLDVNGTVRIRSISASVSAATVFLTTDANGILISRTAAQVRSDIGAGTGNGTVTSVTGSGGLASSGGNTPDISISNDGVTTVKILNSNVTLAKIQNIAVSTVLGNSSSSAAQAPLEINMTTLATMLSGKTMDIVGNATNVTGVVAIANGGTGTATTTANAFFVGPNGSSGAPSFRVMATADIPTGIITFAKLQDVAGPGLVGRISATAGPVAALTSANARTAIGATTVGSNLITLPDISTSDKFLRVNFADNTVSALDAATFRTAIGAGTGNGSVTSVNGTGTVSGITLTGTVTTTGDLTLGGTLSVTASNFASQTANTFLAAPNGAAGAPTFRAMVSADIPADGIVTTKILNSNVTLAKIQNIAVSTVLGNSSSSAAQAPLEINMTTLAAMLSGKTMDIVGNATNVTGVVAIANGGTGTATAAINTIFAGPSSGSTGAPSFRAIVSADIPSSITLTTPVIGNIKMGYTTTATAAGTTVLTVSSNHYQRFTGSTTQTITLPVTSTLVAGMTYIIENNSTGLLTVNSSGGNLVITVIPGVTVNCLCVGITLVTAADWDVEYDEFASITGTGSVVLSLSPTLVTPTLGVPASGDLSNCTGTAVGLTANTVTTNANLTGPVTSSGNATAITNSAVTYAKIQNVNPNTVLGRITNSAGIVEELSGANIATIIGSSAITNASNVTIATDDSTASSYYLYFGANITGNTPLKASTKIRYNPSTGAFSATTKSFRIPHPTKLEHDLVYGSLESPYHGVRLTGKGKTKGNRAEIFLPDYIKSLIDEETVNIQLTVIKCAKILYIENIIIDDNKFTVKYDKPWYEKCKDIEFYWDFTAERKDVPKLIVEEKI